MHATSAPPMLDIHMQFLKIARLPDKLGRGAGGRQAASIDSRFWPGYSLKSCSAMLITMMAVYRLLLILHLLMIYQGRCGVHPGLLQGCMHAYSFSFTPRRMFGLLENLAETLA